MDSIIKGLLDLSVLGESGAPHVDSTNKHDSPKGVSGADSKNQHNMPTSVPGGTGENAPGVPSDQGPSVPASVELTDKEWKDTLAALQKSFKEAGDIVELLKGTKVVEEKSDEFNLMDWTDDYYSEAVSKEDRSAIEAIVKDVQKDIADDLTRKNGVDYEYANKFFDGLTKINAFDSWWNTRIWQFLGVINIEPDNCTTVVNYLNKTYRERLGDYKIISVKMIGNGFWNGNLPHNVISLIPVVGNVTASVLWVVKTFKQAIKLKFGWKNTKACYMLVIDKKLPLEIEEHAKEVEANIVKGVAADMPKDEESIKESFEWDEFDEATRLAKETHKKAKNATREKIDKLLDVARRCPQMSDEVNDIIRKLEKAGSEDSIEAAKGYLTGMDARLNYRSTLINNQIKRQGRNAKGRQRDEVRVRNNANEREYDASHPASKKAKEALGIRKAEQEIKKILGESYEDEESTAMSPYEEYVRAFIDCDYPGAPMSKEEFTEAYLDMLMGGDD